MDYVKYRHGDVMLKPVVRKLKSPIAAQALLHKGQQHHHTLSGEFRIEEDSEGKFLEVIKDTELSHEEHATLKLKPGVYLVDIQLEYDHWLEESRQVID